jgi:hypothetical protein
MRRPQPLQALAAARSAPPAPAPAPAPGGKPLGHAVLSSVPLQVLLAQHVVFFPVWAVAQWALRSAPVLGGGLELALYVALMAVEPARLYLGHLGNLLEGVSTLFAFWVLTVMVELPVVAYLTALASKPAVFAVNLPLLLLLLGERARPHARPPQGRRVD